MEPAVVSQDVRDRANGVHGVIMPSSSTVRGRGVRGRRRRRGVRMHGQGLERPATAGPGVL